MIRSQREANAAHRLGETVILVHGIGRQKGSMRAMAAGLATHGFNILNWGYRSMRQTIAASADALYRCYALAEPLNDQIHFVTHSLGGIVLRCMLKQHPAAKLGRIVMIAPPNQGSAVARMLLSGPPLKWLYGPAGQELMSAALLTKICAIPDTKTLIIAGTKSLDWKNPTSWITHGRLQEPNDGTVTVEETRLASNDESLLIADSHTFLPRNPVAVNATIRFLSSETTPK